MNGSCPSLWREGNPRHHLPPRRGACWAAGPRSRRAPWRMGGEGGPAGVLPPAQQGYSRSGGR